MDELCEVWHATRKMCAPRAYGEVLSVHLPVAFMAAVTVWTAKSVREKKNYMADECARLQRELALRSTLATVETVFAPQQVSLSKSEHESVVVRSHHLSHHF